MGSNESKIFQECSPFGYCFEFLGELFYIPRDVCMYELMFKPLIGQIFASFMGLGPFQNFFNKCLSISKLNGPPTKYIFNFEGGAF